jgi:hypothetical protein
MRFLLAMNSTVLVMLAQLGRHVFESDVRRYRGSYTSCHAASARSRTILLSIRRSPLHVILPPIFLKSYSFPLGGGSSPMLISESSSFKKILKFGKGFFWGKFFRFCIVSRWTRIRVMERPQPITVISAELRSSRWADFPLGDRCRPPAEEPVREEP